MEQRKKLIELLIDSSCCPKETDCEDCEYRENAACREEMIADYLLDNGVVVLPCRCKDCEYSDVAYCRDRKTESKTDIWCVYNENRHKNNYYCADGKRKGGE